MTTASSSSTPNSTLSDQAASWIRAFEVVWDESPPRQHSPTPRSTGIAAWSVVPHSAHSAIAEIHALLPPTPAGLVIYCDKETDEGFLDEMLVALRTIPETAPIIFLDSTAQLPGFAKSLALEQPSRRILFVHFPETTIPAAPTIIAELRDLSGFREIRFDAEDRRFLPSWQVIEFATNPGELPISFEDVVLVTGGAKGITSECIAALAASTGAAVALVGRSSPDDPQVLAARQRLAAMGIAHHYWSADISDAATTANLVRSVTDTLGTITAIIHGAGIHAPCDVPSMSTTLMQQHCHAKVDGLRNLLSTVDPSALKVLVTFGSVIAHSGYARSGAYAFANDQLARLVAAFHACHPSTRCQTLDWSAWLETGMGVNLGAIDEMKSAGVDPITNEQGVRLFLDCLRQPKASLRPILAGRFPSSPTASFTSAAPKIDLPEATVVAYTPEVEIIVETSLSLHFHPFLAGHSLDGQVILPGVLLIEFMLRASSALQTPEPVSLITNVAFSRPVRLPGNSPLILCIQAIRQPDGSVECMLAPRNESLADAPSVRATFGHAKAEPAPSCPSVPDANLEAGEGTAIAGELYEHLLFHTDAFRIVESYTTATAKTAVFHLPSRDESKLAPEPSDSETLIRDAFIHGIQLCVPGELLLPSKVTSISRHSPVLNARTIVANEISCQDNEFTYDFIAVDANGSVVEIWNGLVLRPYRTLQITSSNHPILQSIQEERSGQAVPAPHPASHSTKRYFEYLHTVGFKETNLVGNVYFTNHLEWQGRCREMFLHQHAPALLKDVQSGQLALVTVSCSCDYLAELQPFDELSIRMTLEAHGHDWASMRFEYWREAPGTPILIAIGLQKIASRHRSSNGLAATPMPVSLISALQPFA